MFKGILGSRLASVLVLVLVGTLIAASPGAASTIIWKRLISSKGGSFTALAAAPSGGVFAAIGQYPFSQVRRYSATGAVVWKRTMTGDYWVGVTDIAADATGAYVSAYDGAGEDRDGREMLLRKYRNDGSVAWTARWGTVDFYEQVRSIAVHDGVVYAFYDGAQAYADQIARFDAATGQRMAGSDIEIPFTDADSTQSATNIAVTDQGITVFTGGALYNGTPPVMLLKRLSLDGTPIWTRRLGTGSDEFTATGMVLDSAGITLTYQPESHNAHPRVARYGLGGHKAFDHALPGYASGPAAGDGTSIYATYETPLGAADHGSIGIRRFSADGVKQADVAVGTPTGDVPYSLLPSGSALYVGAASGEYTFFPLLMKVHKPAAH